MTTLYISQQEVTDIMPESGIKTVASPWFVACSGVILRDRQRGIDTYGHLQPAVMSFERHMQDRQINNGIAVMLFGDRSSPGRVLWDLRDGKWGQIGTKVISFDAGGTWWTGVFDIISGEVRIARRKPTQSILCYQAFAPAEAEGAKAV